MKAKTIAAALVAGTMLAGCGGGGGSSSGDPASFARQVYEHVFKGDTGWTYDHLHPAQRKLVSYNDFNSCLQAALLMAKSFGSDFSQNKVTRVTTGKKSSTKVPGTETEDRAVGVTIYFMNAKHPGKADSTAGHVFFTDEGLRWVMDAEEIGKERKGKC